MVARPPWTTTAKWDRLHVGMTQKEVFDSLGEPTSKVGPVQWQSNQGKPIGRDEKIAQEATADALDIRMERWHYGGGVLESIAGPPPDAFVIYFDSEKRVSKLRRPLNKQQAVEGIRE